MKNLKKPELLAPAGTLEKLKTALTYGADSVYLGALDFSLRTAASSFSYSEIEKGIEYAHLNKKKVYLALNINAKDSNIKKISSSIKKINILNPDGIIISDAGIFSILKNETNIKLHI